MYWFYHPLQCDPHRPFPSTAARRPGAHTCGSSSSSAFATTAKAADARAAASSTTTVSATPHSTRSSDLRPAVTITVPVKPRLSRGSRRSLLPRRPRALRPASPSPRPMRPMLRLWMSVPIFLTLRAWRTIPTMPPIPTGRIRKISVSRVSPLAVERVPRAARLLLAGGGAKSARRTSRR